jgi:hypothetical protein
MGNICNTCAFLFERLDGANDRVTLEKIEKELANGVLGLTTDTVSAVTEALPAGSYEACLLTCRPVVAQPYAPNDYFSHDQIQLYGIDPFWGLPHDPRTEYYRVHAQSIEPRRKLFEFVVPMFPHTWLKPDVVQRYRALLAEGTRPTALAVSVVDVKGPAVYEGEDDDHLCLTHYLLDGHHKFLGCSAVRPRDQPPLLSEHRPEHLDRGRPREGARGSGSDGCCLTGRTERRS